MNLSDRKRPTDFLTRCWQRLAQFCRATEAVAVVEFALVFPFIILLYVGSVETSLLVSLDRRLGNVAGSLGDLVSRADGEISSSELDDYFDAAALVMQPYDDTNLKQVVTCLHLAADDSVTVVWSVGDNGANAHVAGETFTLPTELKSIVGDTYVIIAEAAISYLPLNGVVVETPISLYKQFFYLPRFGAIINLV